VPKERKEVVIVQPYVPDYRVPLLGGLVRYLRERDIDCIVASGTPVGTQLLRADASTGHVWQKQRRTRSLVVRGRWFRTYGSRRVWKHADAVVVELASGALDSYLALLGRRRRPVGVWGHVGSFVGDQPPAMARLIRWQLARANRTFAYTEHGAALARAWGVEADRITIVQNTIDTSALQSALAAVDPSASAAFKAAHGLGDGAILAYVGSLDASKRMDFLAECLERLWELRPDVQLVVGGGGTDAHLLDHAVQRGQVVMLGRVAVPEKALIGSVAEAMLMPGRVGLVAVDSLALRLPIITTSWNYHGPEFDYLTAGVTCIVADDTVDAYVAAVIDALDDPLALSAQRAALARDADRFGMREAIERMGGGIMTLLDVGGA
jgi:glycosyltransferase involved in cell wall biosynthesis